MNAARDYLSIRIEEIPQVAVILGTGLGALAEDIDTSDSIPYNEIPNFPISTVESHTGRLLIGTLSGVPVLAMQGRFHLYEGYSAQEVTLPVRVLSSLGIKSLIISNAAGGMNPLFRRGDIMMITDHINLQYANPLEGPNVDEWGPRFPDMSEPYDRALRDVTESVALELGVRLVQGVYIAVAGPNLETKAEYRYLRAIGGDVVGMSTVPEVIVARHMDMRVLAFSVITDECFPDALKPVSIEEVLAAAASAEPDLRRLISSVITRF
ncbi:MAG: purine-nucleoside phosphorylase [Rhodothermia bacterium]|nr:MAG: purine-nucleoside phosphorylase [Rhodothermia bacterium]